MYCLPTDRYHNRQLVFLSLSCSMGAKWGGPLDLVKEQWDNPNRRRSQCTPLHWKWERASSKLHWHRKNMRNAQANQRTWYDRKERSFQPGQQVLLLLPMNNSKLLARWQGPYQITKKVSKLNYEPHMNFSHHSQSSSNSLSGSSKWTKQVSNSSF